MLYIVCRTIRYLWRMLHVMFKFSESKRKKIRKAFGSLVKEKRIELDLSQEDLGFNAGLHRTYIGSIERGEANVSLENIAAIAIALQCEISELMPTMY